MNNSFRDIFKNHELLEGYNLLFEASEAYEEILYNDYIYELEDGSVIKVYFTKDDFHHLIGLHKLKDIAEVNKNKKSTANIYKDIRNKKITHKTIENSVFLEDMYKRMTNFQDIKEVVYSKAIIRFDKKKVPSSLLKGDTLLYKEQLVENNILSLISKKRKNETICTPETFFVQENDYYFKDQIELKVVGFEVTKSGLIKSRRST